jgi:hypothetical protein
MVMPGHAATLRLGHSGNQQDRKTENKKLLHLQGSPSKQV